MQAARFVTPAGTAPPLSLLAWLTACWTCCSLDLIALLAVSLFGLMIAKYTIATIAIVTASEIRRYIGLRTTTSMNLPPVLVWVDGGQGTAHYAGCQCRVGLALVLPG